MNSEDVIIWEDDPVSPTWCYLEELPGMNHLSDDYRVLSCGSDEWYALLNGLDEE